MIGMYGARGVRVKLFYGREIQSLEEELNAFLEEKEGGIIDIQLGSNERSFDVMVVYRDETKS